MNNFLMIAIGGAAGALSRHGLVNIINHIAHTKWQLGPFPLATLSVNIIGSFCIGMLYVLITERLALHADWRNVTMVGFMGAFTTFSTFSLETVILLEKGQIIVAFAYILSSVLVCVLAAWLAIVLTRMI
ncbi:MAG: fluoride efflux transporter CrcB [Spongiibacteraceae bacterium]